jgi:hypothetical protein
MSQGRPRLFSPGQCAELWRRYKAGESILGITRVLWAGGTRLFTAFFKALGALRQLHGDGLPGF